MFREMVMEIKKSEEIMEGMARMIASKSAVKTGDILTPDEMNSLIDDLFATENPYFCPSGRPTIIKIGLEELKRRFGG
jgi:DNA mismatch repair protein MutL